MARGAARGLWWLHRSVLQGWGEPQSQQALPTSPALLQEPQPALSALAGAWLCLPSTGTQQLQRHLFHTVSGLQTSLPQQHHPSRLGD